MRYKIAAVALLAFSAGYFQAHGQIAQDSIYLGTTRLTLGMPKDAVIAALAGSYEVRNLGEGQVSSWIVSSKNGPPFKAVGNVVFKDGKLSSVLKYWGPEDQQKGVEFATSLYGVIDGFAKEGRRTCTISVGQKQDPGYENKAMFITCGEKYIRIDIDRSEKTGESADITEVLERK